jgi:hypothetical protein
MNAGMERAINSENLGARIMGNGALDQKIWALEVMRGKMVISEGSGGIAGILEWLGSWRKRQGLMQNLGDSQGF